MGFSVQPETPSDVAMTDGTKTLLMTRIGAGENATIFSSVCAYTVAFMRHVEIAMPRAPQNCIE